MRLWTLHPRYLDAKGLVAAWRESLLAQKVLHGATRGYNHHPQLFRFKTHSRPLHAIATFLTELASEADRRGYSFDSTKISSRRLTTRIEETEGQLLYEWEHLKRKLRERAPAHYRQLRKIKFPDPHPLFCIVPGDVRDWERTS